MPLSYHWTYQWAGTLARTLEQRQGSRGWTKFERRRSRVRIFTVARNDATGLALTSDSHTEFLSEVAMYHHVKKLMYTVWLWRKALEWRSKSVSRRRAAYHTRAPQP